MPLSVRTTRRSVPEGRSDGSVGIEAILGEGGITFAQDEETALHDSMPRCAIAMGGVDYVLSPKGIAEELARIGSLSYVNGTKSDRVLEEGFDKDRLADLFRQLHNASGVDFGQYLRSTILRRPQRRMAIRKSEDLSSYQRLIRDDKYEVATLYQDLLIRVTSFFRDPKPSRRSSRASSAA
jgi:two-component system CheB/CheR fusion protein